MSISFNADEVFEIAQAIERNGARFYRRAAEGASVESSRKLLLTLASLEDQHLKVFSDMREELRRVRQAPQTFDPDGEATAYLRAFADGRIFNPHEDPSKRLCGNETTAQILLLALGVERDSIVFYLGMKELVPERLGRDRVQGIIKQEMGHVAMISKELASLQ